MKREKLKVGARDVAMVAGVSYRTALRHEASGRFKLDAEDVVGSLVSLVAYLGEKRC